MVLEAGDVPPPTWVVICGDAAMNFEGGGRTNTSEVKELVSNDVGGQLLEVALPL